MKRLLLLVLVLAGLALTTTPIEAHGGCHRRCDVTVFTPAESGDDGYWAPTFGAFDNTQNIAGVGDVGGALSFTAFVRVPSVTLPHAQDITSAVLGWTKADINTDVARMRVYAEAADNPLAVSSFGDGDGRVRTTAFTDVDDVGAVTSVDVTAQVIG